MRLLILRRLKFFILTNTYLHEIILVLNAPATSEVDSVGVNGEFGVLHGSFFGSMFRLFDSLFSFFDVRVFCDQKILFPLVLLDGVKNLTRFLVSITSLMKANQ